MLFGDSHAAQWADSLVNGAQDEQITVVMVTAAGCPPVPMAGSPGGEACDLWRDDALAHIDTLNPDLTLLSMRTTYEGVEVAELEHALLRDGTPSPLQSLGKIAWLADTPSFSTEAPPACASRNSEDLAHCDGNRQDVLPERQNSILHRQVAALGGVWIDLTAYLCDETSCPVVLGDVLVYKDDDHVSSTFARELEDVFLRAIHQAISES